MCFAVGDWGVWAHDWGCLRWRRAFMILNLKKRKKREEDFFFFFLLYSLK